MYYTLCIVQPDSSLHTSDLQKKRFMYAGVCFTHEHTLTHVYIFMYVYFRVYMHIYYTLIIISPHSVIHTSDYPGNSVYMRVCVLHTQIYIYICIYICICTYTYVYIYYVYIYVYMYTYKYVCIHISMYVYIYLYICMYQTFFTTVPYPAFTILTSLGKSVHMCL